MPVKATFSDKFRAALKALEDHGFESLEFFDKLLDCKSRDDIWQLFIAMLKTHRVNQYVSSVAGACVIDWLEVQRTIASRDGCQVLPPELLAAKMAYDIIWGKVK